MKALWHLERNLLAEIKSRLLVCEARPPGAFYWQQPLSRLVGSPPMNISKLLSRSHHTPAPDQQIGLSTVFTGLNQ